MLREVLRRNLDNEQRKNVRPRRSSIIQDNASSAQIADHAAPQGCTVAQIMAGDRGAVRGAGCPRIRWAVQAGWLGKPDVERRSYAFWDVMRELGNV